MKRLLHFLLRRTGKRYTPADDLPQGLILGTLFGRALQLVRGLIRLRRVVYIGSRVRLRGKPSIEVGRHATLCPGCRIDGYATEGVHIGERSKIGDSTIISCTSHLSRLGHGVSIGRDCGIGEFGYLGASGGIRIGNDVIMGQYVSFHSQNHRFDDPGRPIRDQEVESIGIVIEDDVWIGAKATFLDGSHVGRHSVVAAGAVVQGKFPPYSVVGGVPARILRSLQPSPESGPHPARSSGED